MLDDENILKQRDPDGALEVAAALYKQAGYEGEFLNTDHDGRAITSIVVAGMGGSALAADIAKVLLSSNLSIPFEVVKGYDLPAYATAGSLVIASSHSGNTEETVSCLEQAIERGCQIAVISTGGKLADIANERDIMLGLIPHDTQPRMAVLYNLRVLLRVLKAYELIDTSIYDEMKSAESWLKSESELWGKSVPTERNYAKLLALIAVGKTPVFYGGSLMAPLAYKWKISWNENAKNVAFWNYVPENNHNEFIGWTSHPVEKPFVIFDLVSEQEHPRIQKRFGLNDRLLSGMRPKSNVVPIQGDTVLKQLLWGSILADFVSIYVAVLNGVDPTPVELIEKLKVELGK